MEWGCGGQPPFPFRPSHSALGWGWFLDTTRCVPTSAARWLRDGLSPVWHRYRCPLRRWCSSETRDDERGLGSITVPTSRDHKASRGACTGPAADSPAPRIAFLRYSEDRSRLPYRGHPRRAVITFPCNPDNTTAEANSETDSLRVRRDLSQPRRSRLRSRTLVVRFGALDGDERAHCKPHWFQCPGVFFECL